MLLQSESCEHVVKGVPHDASGSPQAHLPSLPMLIEFGFGTQLPKGEFDLLSQSLFALPGTVSSTQSFSMMTEPMEDVLRAASFFFGTSG